MEKRKGGLCLDRKIGESIKIGNEISFEIMEIKKGKVTLWISAPRNVGILRGELNDKK